MKQTANPPSPDAPRINLHIYGSSITHESRIMRETEAIGRLGIADRIYILGLWEDGLPEVEVLDELRTILRARLLTRKLGNSTLARALQVLEWALRIVVRFAPRKVTLVNIHYLAGLPLGVLLKFTKGAKLVYDTHELETERSGWGRGRRFMAKLMERALYRLVDATIVVSSGIADWYEEAYGRRPYTILSTPSLASIRYTEVFRQTFQIPKDSIIFLYQGVLGRNRSIENILKAFQRTEQQNKVIVFMGYGPFENLVREAAATYKNIYFHPAVPTSALLSYTSSAEIGFCLSPNTSISYYLASPNKLFEYAMAGLPVIVPNFGERKRLAETYQIGYVLKDDSVESISELIDGVNRDMLASFQSNLAEFANVFNWENQEKTLRQLYGDLGKLPAGPKPAEALEDK